MTTYEQGRAPHGAPVTWRILPHSSCIASVCLPTGPNIDAHREQADAICRAFHVAKLAEDYVAVKTAMDDAPTAKESATFLAAYYAAARALCEAVRS